MVRNRLYFVRIHRIRYALMRDRSGYSVDRPAIHPELPIEWFDKHVN